MPVVYKSCTLTDSAASAVAAVNAEMSAAMAEVNSKLSDFDAALAAASFTIGPKTYTIKEGFAAIEAVIERFLAVGRQRGSNLAENFFDTIQSAVPNSQDDAEARLAAHNVHLLDGIGLIESGVNLVTPRDAYKTLNRNYALWKQLLSQPAGALFVTVWVKRVVSVNALDGCGIPLVEEKTVFEFVGINKNVKTVAADHGVPLANVIATVYWIGQASPTASTVHMLRNVVKLNDVQIAHALSEASAADPDGRIPLLFQNNGGCSLRASLIIEPTLPVTLEKYFTQAQIVTLLLRYRPYGIAELFSEFGPIGGGPWFVDARERLLSAPTSSVAGGIRPSQQDAVQQPLSLNHIDDPLEDITDNGKPLIPHAVPIGVLLTSVNLSKTLDVDQFLLTCDAIVQAVSDDLKIFTMIKLVEEVCKIVLTVIGGAAKAMQEVVNGILSLVNHAIQSVLDMFGSPMKSALSALLCLLGPVNFALGMATDGLTELSELVDKLFEALEAPIQALYALIGAISIPMCVGMSLMEAILPSALLKCLPLEFPLPPEVVECLNRILGEIREALSTLLDCLDGTQAALQAAIGYMINILSAQLSFAAGGVSSCFPVAVAELGASVSLILK